MNIVFECSMARTGSQLLKNILKQNKDILKLYFLVSKAILSSKTKETLLGITMSLIK